MQHLFRDFIQIQLSRDSIVPRFNCPEIQLSRDSIVPLLNYDE